MLPGRVQGWAFDLLTMVSRRRLSSRTTPLPPLGRQDHLTAVIRLPLDLTPGIELGGAHYLYPPDTVHVTVVNLDRATVEPTVAIARLRSLDLAAPRFIVNGLGCSPDTIFVRCLHDADFAMLRREVDRAFGVERAGRVPSVMSKLSFANVVRFDGPGECPEHLEDLERRAEFAGSRLEIVRTDRYLSEGGTTVLAEVPLTTPADSPETAIETGSPPGRWPAR